MQNNQRWLYLFTIVIFLTSSCRPTETEDADTLTTSNSVPFLKTVINIAFQDNDPNVVEANECLNCHSDKNLLIETAKPEEMVESESEGVG